MKKISKYKVEPILLIMMIAMAIISVMTIFSAQHLLPSYMQDLAFKQFLWYILGFVIAYFMMFVGNQFIYRHVWILYGLGVLLLLLVLIYGTPINDIRSWFVIKGIGNIQPSEFMKIILILTLGTTIHNFNEKYPDPELGDEFLFLLKVGIIVLIPSILTFLQPDTGVVLIYLLITTSMLFVSGIRYRWFGFLAVLVVTILTTILSIYFLNKNLFTDIFGTSFFLRIDRLLDWSNKSGYQLQNGLNAIGGGGLFGYGFNNTPIYFPEPQTDFIFATFASNFGLIGSVALITLITTFDIRLITLASKTSSNINKYVIAGIIGMLLYQQVQNIGMTLGLLPITGITLPFISYGGSSLLSYMIMAGIFFNISNESLRFTN